MIFNQISNFESLPNIHIGQKVHKIGIINSFMQDMLIKHEGYESDPSLVSYDMFSAN